MFEETLIISDNPIKFKILPVNFPIHKHDYKCVCYVDTDIVDHKTSREIKLLCLSDTDTLNYIVKYLNENKRSRTYT